MSVGAIVTGAEEREFNGPLKPPMWDGNPGTRVGQTAYDEAAALFTPAGPINWDGAAWVKYSANGDNIGNADLTLTGDRILNGDGHDLTMSSINNLHITADLGVDVTASDHVTIEGTLQANFRSAAAGGQTTIGADNGILTLFFGSGITMSWLNGSPEGVVTSGPCSIRFQLDGAPGSMLWFKQTGTGNTGWVSIA